MHVAGQGELLGAGPTTRVGLRFHHQHPPPGARERDGRHEAVRSRPDDDRVVLDRSGQWSCSSGMVPPMRVPEPGELSTVSVPAHRAEPVAHVHESVALRRRRPDRSPAPVSATQKSRCSSSPVIVTVMRRPLARVLPCVLHRLQAAEVDRGLGLGRRTARSPRRSPRSGAPPGSPPCAAPRPSPRSRSSGG